MWDKKLISGLSITKLCLKIEFPGQRNCTLTVYKAVNVTLTLTRIYQTVIIFVPSVFCMHEGCFKIMGVFLCNSSTALEGM